MEIILSLLSACSYKHANDPKVSNDHEYLISIAKAHNVEIKPEWFYVDKCTETEVRRTLIVGIILSKKPQLKEELFDFVRRNDE